ncbi:MAG: hypothetical protein ACLSH6_00425 [Limosilactobacillus pontis]
MNYFITSRQDMLTSAIELAQVKRLRIFDSLHQPAMIVTLCYNFDHREVEKKLGVGGRVINLFQYFQKLPYHVFSGRVDGRIAEQVLNQSGYTVQNEEHAAYCNGKNEYRLFIIIIGFVILIILTAMVFLIIVTFTTVVA